MKRFIFKTTLFLLVFFCNIIAFAQDKQDAVIMTNGEKREGKVVSVKDDAIKFIYKGENLEYEFKKSDINKIVFASGRTETFSNAVSPDATFTSTAAERKGKIAILPFEFITNDSGLNVNSMSEQLQNDSYLSVKQNTTGLQVQDPITTNSILAKNGLSHANLKSKSPKEMAILLGVENVVYGITNVTNKGAATYGSGLSTYNDKSSEKKENRKEETKASGSVYSSNNSTTLVQYDTKVELSFYNDQGTNLYSESRNSFGSGFDASHATINYLIKRSPFGSKTKH